MFIKSIPHYSGNSNNAVFWIAVNFVITVRLYLVSAQTLDAESNEGHDSALFIKLAESISKGNWLGEYNNLTLAKGPFYPIWIALNYKIGLPLLFSQHLLYIISCITFIYVLSPTIKKRYLFLIFILILFNPMSYTSSVMTSVLREGIYPAFAIFVVSICIQLLLNYNSALRVRITWSVFIGIFLSALWLTREESIWIIPFVVIVFTFILIKTIAISKSFSIIGKQVIILLMPFSLLILSILFISFLNNIFYGVFEYNEIKSSYFQSSYGALLRIKHKKLIPALPLPMETREKIYSVSPAFRELRPFLEGEVGERWGSIPYKLRQDYEKGLLPPIIKQSISDFLKNDKSGVWRNLWANALYTGKYGIYGFWFLWAFRDAVTSAGYKTGSTSKEFYFRLADEINLACKNHKLDCLPSRSYMYPPWHAEYLMPVLKTFFNSFLHIMRFYDFNPEPRYSTGDIESIELFKEMTNEEITPLYSPRSFVAGKNVNSKISILKWIGKTYQVAIPYIYIVILLLYFFITVKYFTKVHLCDYWIVSTSIQITILFFLLGLSYIHVTSIFLLGRMLSPIYPLMLINIIFVGLSAHCIMQNKE